MRRNWVVVVTALIVAMGLVAGISAGQGKRAEGRAAKDRPAGALAQERGERWAVAALLTAAAELPEAKDILNKYHESAGGIERQLAEIRHKYAQEIQQAKEANKDADVTAILQKAKAEMLPLIKQLVEPRAKSIESLAQLARQQPDAVVEKMVENAQERWSLAAGGPEAREKIREKVQEKVRERREKAGKGETPAAGNPIQ